VAAHAPVLEKLSELSALGYPIIVDGRAPEEVLEVARTVKLDVTELDSETLVATAAGYGARGLELLAAGVADYETFDLCRSIGFDRFQGSFFTEPRTIGDEGIPATRLAKVQLVAALQNPAVEIAELGAIISRDVGLSYRLLRYLNSAFFYLPRHVDSIQDAVVMLGQRSIRDWATLLAIGVDDGRPGALLATGLARAKMCELLAPFAGVRDRAAGFTVGLFSVVDAFLDVSLADVVDALPLSPEIERALVAHEGPHGELLAGVLEYESGQFDAAAARFAGHAPVREVYLQAIAWADDAARLLNTRD
jgi:EAL and modified HD-GYP domain-containing signal transduction protein